MFWSFDLSLLEEISNHLQRGDHNGVGELARRALDNGMAPADILDNGLIAGMSVVGEKFKKHEIFLPDVLLAARAMYAGMDLLKPLLIKDNIPTLGKVVLGSVQGDVHDIGKNLVGIMLKGAGFEIIDLGHDVSPDDFVDAAVREKARVIGMSALLTTTMPVMKKVVNKLKEMNLSGEIKTVIGGAPVTADYAASIGADAYAYDGLNAVDKIKAMLGIQ